ncbi:hypothetical protein [Streptosporangium sp. NPDC049644]|uniref:hypothetical protein n=1 Tax=Streptosporangium sp. NPDC049644 TaxID=3155507 RepID=UPI00342C634D
MKYSDDNGVGETITVRRRVRSRRPEVLAALVPAVAAMAVGLWSVTTPSYWRDESVSVLAASMPIADLWNLLDAIDRVHALYYLLLRPVAAISTGELARSHREPPRSSPPR